MSDFLANMVVVVTGAASGIGRAIAEEAARRGVLQLVLSDRDSEGLDQVVQELSVTTEIEPMVTDLTDLDAPEQIATAAKEKFGRIDGLVNAAGITDRANFLDGTPELWDRMFRINARAPFLLMQAAILDMRARKSPGSIVNIQSINAHCGGTDLAIYSASKGALQTLTKNAANAHLQDRIRVNGINLGWVNTPAEHQMQAHTLGKGEEWAQEVGEAMPLGRLLMPQEAAPLALYLLDPISAPLTGQSMDLEQRVVGAPP